MHRLLLDLPSRVETERLMLRAYERGDGPWYYAMSRRNREHLSTYESGNAAMFINSVDDAEVTVRQFALDWAARIAFFLGAFDRKTGEFVAQIYIGIMNWDVGSFVVGYFCDVDHQGQGYVTEAVRGALRLIFGPLHGTRASIYCDDTNGRSARVAERCGFAREGHIRANHQRRDAPVSGDYVYGLLREEYLAQGAVPWEAPRPAEPELRLLSRDEILEVRRLDRRERIDRVYHVESGELVLQPEVYDMQGWPPGAMNGIVRALQACHDGGGWILGAFVEERLVGIASLEPAPVASAPEQVQLSLLNVSYGHRDEGLGARLFEAARAEARRRGARAMYISATPSEHTIGFYLARGCRLNPTPDPGLYAQEPEDIHLLCDVL